MSCKYLMLLLYIYYYYIFFFFQAEDGIRDYKVTGVQTCALPIYPFPVGPRTLFATPLWRHCLHGRWRLLYGRAGIKLTVNLILHCLVGQVHHPANARGQAIYHLLLEIWIRSEEHTSELQSPCNLVCRLLLEKKKNESN